MRGFFLIVRAERLELSHLAALDPKSSVSTNSTTPAIRCANIKICFNIQTLIFIKIFLLFVFLIQTQKITYEKHTILCART